MTSNLFCGGNPPVGRGLPPALAIAPWVAGGATHELTINAHDQPSFMVKNHH